MKTLLYLVGVGVVAFLALKVLHLALYWLVVLAVVGGVGYAGLRLLSRRK